MPSSNERALEKAKTIPADAIIFDLEDAVAPDAKEAARANAVAAVQSGEYGGKTLTIRCNGVDTPGGADDLKAAAAASPAAGGVPKGGGPGHPAALTAIPGAPPPGGGGGAPAGPVSTPQ